MEPNCSSYNFNISARQTGDHECELNNATNEGHEHEMEGNPDYLYRGVKVNNWSITDLSIQQSPYKNFKQIFRLENQKSSPEQWNTVEPRFNEPLYNEVPGITNDIFQPSNSVMYGKEPRYNETSI